VYERERFDSNEGAGKGGNNEIEAHGISSSILALAPCEAGCRTVKGPDPSGHS
jgi:hypothetical protein